MEHLRITTGVKNSTDYYTSCCLVRVGMLRAWGIVLRSRTVMGANKSRDRSETSTTWHSFKPLASVVRGGHWLFWSRCYLGSLTVLFSSRPALAYGLDDHRLQRTVLRPPIPDNETSEHAAKISNLTGAHALFGETNVGLFCKKKEPGKKKNRKSSLAWMCA